jgi:hypothetical protein
MKRPVIAVEVNAVEGSMFADPPGDLVRRPPRHDEVYRGTEPWRNRPTACVALVRCVLVESWRDLTAD